jgi:ComF family protein
VRGAASLALEVFASVLAPPRCAACDARVPWLAAFCAACASTAQRAAASEDGQDGAIAALVYGGAVARAIVRLKYERRPDLARPLGDLLWRALEPSSAALSGVVVVPVPLHPSRLADRGFNQSALIASRVARHLDAPLRARALARARDTPPQATLDRTARLANLAGAFLARYPGQIRARDILLIDDVRTTGATLDACARASIDAGARSVRSAVVAAAPS